MPKSLEQMKQELDAYHGSPHRFPPTEKNPLGEFDPTKIGTGEGAQAYGHGHYLAEAPKTAKGYADQLGKFIDRIQTPEGDMSLEDALTKHHPLGSSIAKAVSKQRNKSGVDSFNQLIEDELIPEMRVSMKLPKERWGEVVGKRGNFYHVRIPHEHIEKMLDWDKPLSEQHPHVQAAIRQELPDAHHAATGRDLYSAYGATAKAASDKLRRAGVSGIKYTDALSRINGDAGKIVEKYGSRDAALDVAKQRLQSASMKDISYWDKIVSELQKPNTRNFVVFPGNEHIMKVVHREAKGGAIHEGNSVRVTTYKAKGGAVNDGRVPVKSREFFSEGDLPKPKENHVRIFRGSWETEPKYIVEENPRHDVYGGVFGSSGLNVAKSHGNQGLHYTDIPQDKILTHYDLNYEIPYEKTKAALLKAQPHLADDPELFDDVYKIVVEDASQDLRNVNDDLINKAFGPYGPEVENEVQRIRGQVSKNLGYQAVEMVDEHGGGTYLVSPGAEFKTLENIPQNSSKNDGNHVRVTTYEDSKANKEKFLADSKIKDRLYHATPRNFKAFKPGGNDPEISGHAIWLSSDPTYQAAGHNIGDPRNPNLGVQIMPVHVQAKKPLVLDNPDILSRFQKIVAGGDKSFPFLMDKQWAKKVKDMGYDSVVHADPHGRGDPHEVIMFHPNKIKSAIGNRGTYDTKERDINKANGGLAHMADGGQPFYSPVDQAISKLSQAKGTGDQYLSMIRNTHGVKPQEIEDRGLEQKMTGKMGLPDVQRIASENPMPKITESVAHKSDFFVTQKGDDDKHYVLNDTGKRIEGPFETKQNAEGAINRLKGNKTQYEKYQLKGGNNYREIKLKLPVQETNRGAYGNGELSLGYGASNNFKSSHFKNEPNILAHARVSDRKGPNGEKILHVEEIQSDWHQQARDLRHEEIDRLVENGMPEEEAKKAVPTNWGYGTPEDRKHIVDKLARDEKLTPEEESRRRQLLSNRVVPDAPFKKDWHELALKHLLDHAVKNGYDKMIITQGAEQAKRYDLSKHIGEINYKHNPDKTVSLMATDKENGSTVLHEEDVPHHKIHRYVGKGIAKKIMAGEGNPMRVGDPSGQVQSYVPQTGRNAGKMTLSNLDLKTGDEGMKGFYDKIVPDFLNKYGKKWGAKVGTYRMADPDKDYHWSDYVPNTDDMNRIGMERFGVNQRDMTSDQSAEAKEIHRKSVADKRAINLHSFDITPQMREDIMSKGQSRYNKGGDVKPPSLDAMRYALMVKGGKAKDLTKYTDPPSTQINDWKWRNLADVDAELNIKKIPDYIQKNFGEFMKQQLDKAKAGDMTARDILKAYGITQSSIGRSGLSYNTATKTGMKLPRQDVVRPEGAFSEWLGSKHGQTFLKAAEKGDVNEDSLEDLKEKFSPFSMTNALADRLRWAVENISNNKDYPELANKIATMPLGKYRDLIMGMKGIKSAKMGFMGSLIGRGDQPTLDARQVLLHTGKYNKDPEFQRRTQAIVKGKPVAGIESVDRLIARQNAMGMEIDPTLEFFRQHLTHHAIWDQANNSETTHGDVVNAMKNYKAGGGIKEPKSTVPAYKLFRVDKKQPGKLFPLFVDANTPVEKDKWVPAKAGEMAGKKVKSKIGPLAYRPGWHAGDLPIATHIGEKSDPKLNKPDRRPNNQVWAEIDMPNDVDWQKKANERGMNKKGKLIAKNAHITDQIPKGGHYRYKTNPNMSGSWLIGGEMKVKRVLPDEEVQKINKKAKVSDLPRSEPLNLKDWGFKHGGSMSLLKKFKD